MKINKSHIHSLTLKMESSSRQSMFRATVLATWTASRAASAAFSSFFLGDESCLKLDWIYQNRSRNKNETKALFMHSVAKF